MHLRVGRIDKLSENNRILNRTLQLLCLRNGTLHALCAVREDNLCAVCLDQISALDAHGFRHGQNDMIALCRADCRKSDAGIAAGRLNNRCARLEHTGSLCIRNHCICNAILDASCRVEIFQLCQNGCFQIIFLLITGQLHQRRAAN